MPYLEQPSFTPPSSASPVREQRRGGWIGPLVFRTSALLIGVAAGAALFYLPVFAVSEVKVVGAQRLQEADILQQLSLRGNNLLALPIQDLRAQLLQNPWVQDVELRRSLPGHVTIALEERTPAVVWQVAKEQYWVARDGTVLEAVKLVNPSLPLIKDLNGGTRRSGDRVNADAVVLSLSLVELLPQEVRDEAKFFEYLSYGGIVVETKQGYRARFGDSQDLAWKLAVWKAVLDAADREKLKVGHVDLRFGDRPFFRP